MLLFGEPQQKSDAISWVLQNPTHAGSVFQLALRQYQPPTNTRGQIRDQNEVLRNVLERALNFRGEFNGESWKVLRTILAQQGGIRLATEWVRTSENLSDSPPLRDIIQAIAEVGGLGAGEQFVNWISSDRPELIVLGLHGLKELNFGVAAVLSRRSSVTAWRARRSLRRLWLTVSLRDYPIFSAGRSTPFRGATMARFGDTPVRIWRASRSNLF